MAQNYTQSYNRSQSQRANPYNDQPEDYASQLWQSAFNNTKPGLGGAMGGGAVPGIQPQQPQQPPPVSSFVNQKPSGGAGANQNPWSGMTPSPDPSTMPAMPPNLPSFGSSGAASPWLPGSFGSSGNYSQQAQQAPLALSSGGRFDSRSSPTRPTSGFSQASQAATYDPGTPMPGVGGSAGDLTTGYVPRYAANGQLIPPGFMEDANGNVVWDPSNGYLPPGETPEGPGVDLVTGQPADLPATPPVYRDEPPAAGTTPPSTGGGSFQGTANPNWFGGFDLSRQYDASSAKGTFMVLAEQSGVDPTAFSKEQSEAWFRQHIQPGLEAAGFEVMDVQGDKAFIRTTENPSGEWIDFVSNAGGGNAQYAWQSDHDPGASSFGMTSNGTTTSTQSSLSPFANRKGDGDGRDGIGGAVGASYGGAGDTSGISADQRQNGLWGRTEMPDYAAQIMAWLFGEGQNLYNR